MIKVYQIPSEVMKTQNIFPFSYGMGEYDLAANIKHYVHVCDVAGDDLDECFKIGNIGPESFIKRHKRMHSFSVGDIFVKDNGDTFVVASFGFDQIEPQFMLSVEEVA